MGPNGIGQNFMGQVGIRTSCHVVGQVSIEQVHIGPFDFVQKILNRQLSWNRQNLIWSL